MESINEQNFDRFEIDGIPKNVYLATKTFVEYFKNVGIHFSCKKYNDRDVVITINTRTPIFFRWQFEQVRNTISIDQITIEYNEDEQIIKITPIIH